MDSLSRKVKVPLLLTPFPPRHLVKFLGTKVVQWVTRWPTDLVVPDSIPVGCRKNPSKGAPLHTALHFHACIVLIRLKYCCKGRKITSHPLILVKVYSIKTEFIHLLRKVPILEGYVRCQGKTSCKTALNMK